MRLISRFKVQLSFACLACAPLVSHGEITAFRERNVERDMMVRTQIEAPPDRRAIQDSRVLSAMRRVPRHAFVPESLQARAYDDNPLPIGYAQTISQPYIVAFMTELLEISSGMKVLEVGTGSGYQAALLAELTPLVCSIEVIEALAERAAKVIKELGYGSVRLKRGDGFNGWKDEAPFDRIMLTFAAEEVPPLLWEQLKPGGIMVAPLGRAYSSQKLYKLRKLPDGRMERRAVLDVAFVPQIRE